MEETLNRILQHQKLTYELLAAMYGDEPIREDENGRWQRMHREESKEYPTEMTAARWTIHRAAVLLYTGLKAPSQSIWSGPRRQSR